LSIDRSEDEAPTEVDVDLSSSASAVITIKPQMVVPVLGTHAPRAPSPSLLEEEDSTATDPRPVAHVAPVRPAMDSVDSVTDLSIDVPVELEDPKEKTTRLLFLLAPPSAGAILAPAPAAVEETPALLAPAAMETARRPRVPAPRKSRLRLFVLLAAMISLSTAASILIVLEVKPPVSASPSPSLSASSSRRGTAARSPPPRSPVKPAPPAAPSAKPAAPLHL